MTRPDSLDAALEAAASAAGIPLSSLYVETLVGSLRVGLSHAFRSLSRHGAYMVDTDGIMRCISPSAARILGYRSEELIGRYTHPVIHHHRMDGSAYPDGDCSVRDVTEPVVLDNECLWRKDGTAVCALFRAQPVLDDDGVVRGTLVYFEKVKRA